MTLSLNMMRNHTFQVMSVIDCEASQDQSFSDTLHRQTAMGCKVLLMLQELYGFNMTYNFDDVINDNMQGDEKKLQNTTTDFFARPMAMDLHDVNIFLPVYPVFTWRYGLIVRRETTKVVHGYYTLPFNPLVWCCLYVMVLLAVLVFFTIHWWEHHILGRGRRPSLTYELLIAIGAFCQHILPIQTHFQSRQLAYFVFFLFTFVIYSFYSSNLLSQIVTDRDNKMELWELEADEYKIITIDTMRPFATNISLYNNSFLRRHLHSIKRMDVKTAVKSLKTEQVALLSDFNTVYPVMRQMLTGSELCQTIEIELYSNIHRFILTTKKFKFREEFKVGMLRLKEAGLLHHVVHKYSQDNQEQCTGVLESESRRSVRAALPLFVLAGAYWLALLVLAGERKWFERVRVYPFVN